MLPAVFGKQRKFFPSLQDLEFWRLLYHQFQSILFLPVYSANNKLISARVYSYIQKEQTWLFIFFPQSAAVPNFSFYQMLKVRWLQTTCHLSQLSHVNIWASENLSPYQKMESFNSQGCFPCQWQHSELLMLSIRGKMRTNGLPRAA